MQSAIKKTTTHTKTNPNAVRVAHLCAQKKAPGDQVIITLPLGIITAVTAKQPARNTSQRTELENAKEKTTKTPPQLN